MNTRCCLLNNSTWNAFVNSFFTVNSRIIFLKHIFELVFKTAWSALNDICRRKFHGKGLKSNAFPHTSLFILSSVVVRRYHTKWKLRGLIPIFLKLYFFSFFFFRCFVLFACFFLYISPSSFFSPFTVIRPTQIFGIFKKKKSNDVVTAFFTWNNSFNLKNEHSNSIEKNTNIFHSILCILLIQICEC